MSTKTIGAEMPSAFEVREILRDHYAVLEELGTDFRNTNLYALIGKLAGTRALLDVGCGSGFFLRTVQSRGVVCEGLEPDAAMALRSSRRLGDAVKIHPLTLQQFARGERQFETITALDILEHLEDDDEALRAIRGSLTADGRAVFVVPAHPLLYGRRDRRTGHYRRYAKRSLLRKLENAGFIVEKARSWNALGALPYLIAEKLFAYELRPYLSKADPAPARRLTAKFLDWWFRWVENRVNFGFGLSLIVVVRPAREGHAARTLQARLAHRPGGA